jgi:hypothetical protein
MQIGVPMTNVTVVIRSVGERTEAVCRNLIAQRVPQENIVTVSNAPFSATLADSYRAGIERGLAWTFCVDADVLVLPNAISGLLDVANKLPAEVCETQGLVLDKFFGVRRPAGNHLYRTSLLSKALGLIPPEGEDIRPECYTLNKMAGAGHPWVETPLVLGLHDFEQYHRDIFRKCYVHARKHDSQMHLLVDYWRRMARQDDDYQVALCGFAAGIAETENVQVDVRRDYGFSKWVPAEEWTEKRALEPGQIMFGEIERTLAKWTSPGEGLERFATGCAQEIVHGGTSLRSNAQRMRRDVGLFQMLPWAMGRALGRVGRQLERLASH